MFCHRKGTQRGSLCRGKCCWRGARQGEKCEQGRKESVSKAGRKVWARQREKFEKGRKKSVSRAGRKGWAGQRENCLIPPEQMWGPSWWEQWHPSVLALHCSSLPLPSPSLQHRVRKDLPEELFHQSGQSCLRETLWEMRSRAAAACQGGISSSPPRLLTGYSRQTSPAISLLEPDTPPAPEVHWCDQWFQHTTGFEQLGSRHRAGNECSFWAINSAHK